MNGAPLIEVRDLSIGLTGRSGATLPILRNIDLSVGKGETIGLVGESGSGKSTLALAMMGYLKGGLKVLGGSTAFRGQSMFGRTPGELEAIRGGALALIPQNAGQALTPSMRIGAQVAEVLKLHSQLPTSDHPRRIVELLTQVRLPEPAALVGRYPHELSGGQQQRVAIAMALAGEPTALLLDEPTTGLDVTTQAHVLELLRELTRGTGTAMVYVSHDLGAIARVCDRVAVMYAGEIVLMGDVRQVLLRPAHPYARGLLSSIPRLKEARLPAAMEGRPPAPGGIGAGCAFADRCTMAEELCRHERPRLEPSMTAALVRCHLRDRIADAPHHLGRSQP
ncbi:MAG: ABC transporter ATP-binding protein, partial [Alphaproteobacteria bacterium]|nr:ABC transporter ATP-binding protein [Alphaproteobacteria bacterium]